MPKPRVMHRDPGFVLDPPPPTFSRAVASEAARVGGRTARKEHWAPRIRFRADCRGERERGVATVELVLVLPLFLILALGLVSSGIVFNHKLDLVHAAREGARYGATIPRNTCTQTPNPCGTSTWAQVVQSVVAQRSDGDVTASQVCVALVSTPTVGSPPVSFGAAFTTNGDGSICYDDGSGDTGLRVQVKIVRSNDAINAAFFRVPVTLTSKATAKFEQ